MSLPETSAPSSPSSAPADPGTLRLNEEALWWASFPAFLRALQDARGVPLDLPQHIEDWALLMDRERLLCLMGPRDHAKTVTALAYIGWNLWRHNRDQWGRILDGLPEGNYEAVYFSATMPLALERVDLLRQFLTDNVHIFGDILPTRTSSALGEFRQAWSRTRIRLRNGAIILPKSIGSTTRGLHPALIVADDIVTDRNSMTTLQRNRVWRYLIGTIYPMVGPIGQLMVLGTPQHQQDALHRLRESPGWCWVKYRAADFDNEVALWPERYSIKQLAALRATDPLLFAREYQMDPRDDITSLFPYALTGQALVPGTFVRPYPPHSRRVGERILLSGDLAVSEEVGADYTVFLVVAYDPVTLKRRLLYAHREKGIGFDDMVMLVRDLCREFAVDIGVIEDNVFQRWLRQHLARYAETATRIFGHTTGVEKQNLTDGIPGMKLALQGNLWEVPSGRDLDGNIIDPVANDFAAVWRSELNAFGYMDGKLLGIGEHDDCVIATWMMERAIRLLEAFMPKEGDPDVVYGDDLGIKRVQIGGAY